MCDGEPLTADGVSLGERWRFQASDQAWQVLNVPLVANLTDDNGDGSIDACDIPDVLVELGRTDTSPVTVELVLLSGLDGSVEETIHDINLSISEPAIVDLDDDGVPEIVAVNGVGHVMALTPKGSVLWEGSAQVFDALGVNQVDPSPPPEDVLREVYVYSSALSVADIDGDGKPEIMVGLSVVDDHGNLVFSDPTQGAEFGLPGPGNEHDGVIRPFASDLDGDGKKEVLFGHVAYRSDGSELFRLNTTPGFSAVGRFIKGGAQVLVTSDEGMTLVDSSGQVLWGPAQLPDSPPIVDNCWSHPASVVDIDGDGVDEALVNTCLRTYVLELDGSGPTILASTELPNIDSSWYWEAASNAFDFRGLGPNWMAYHDSVGLSVFDGLPPVLLSSVSLGSHDSPHFPVVADIDNNGSADILLPGSDPSGREAVIVAYEDIQRRPSPARRIWNEWNYQVGGIREDAKLAPPGPPQGFRVQSRVACTQPAD